MQVEYRFRESGTIIKSLIMKNIILLLLVLSIVSCTDKNEENDMLEVVTTTTMITDLVENIGGDLIQVNGLMGSGIDPHLYKASQGDFRKLDNADVIFYNGLHLEGKLVEIFEKMNEQNKTAIAISNGLYEKTLIGSEYFASNYDPHIWFDLEYWNQITNYVTERLSELDPENKAAFEANRDAYLEKLKALKTELSIKVEELPKEKRILVTAHDAFNYFGRTFDFEVVGLQGLSTATEAGVKDVQRITQFIIENDIKAVFIESSVPRRTVEALQAAVKDQNHEVNIGGELYSDALGSAGTEEGTYIGMYKHNVNTIVNALK
ncbi:ABC-type metal ion transport system, periplasmic component/surface adhesin [Nonlabens dokdonensis DSW-6]|jgi:manganese/zinc/iron transport system substrate-binding protein|uniref:ABC-type metal ion transport system, periplasmic component/surface adhesin n=2 Tax=Nonlabens dokdonensis TaxID=328515 RepID=L7W584_NONDD|nr:ABC-type metal ion transport system, periplasmic component/surface adhesin [Nonlabens dokdonensis DSW-6]